MLEKEFEFYISNQQEFIKTYLGKFLVIKDQSLVGVFDDEIEAIVNSNSKYGKGTFIVQQCLPGNDNYTQTFHSRVIFA